MIQQIILGLVLNIIVAIIAHSRKSLTLYGSLTAIIIGLIIFVGAGGFSWILLTVFFISSSIITHIKKSYKSKLSSEYKKSRRDYIQVIANGAVPAIFSIIYFYTNSQAALLTVIATIAANCSDTWASELGVLSKGKNISILTFKPIPRGESGGVSLWGTIAAAMGSTLIALLYSINLLINSKLAVQTIVIYFIAITIIGLIGSFIDSVLGLTLQARYRDNDNKMTEERKSKKGSNVRISGWQYMTNNMVNLTTSILTSLIAYGVFAAISQ